VWPKVRNTKSVFFFTEGRRLNFLKNNPGLKGLKVLRSCNTHIVSNIFILKFILIEKLHSDVCIINE